MKRFSLILMALLLSCTTLSGFAYDGETVRVYVNGNEIVSDVPAVLVNDSTMLPFRAVFEALGVSNNEIEWNGDQEYIIVRHDRKMIFLTIGNELGIVNDTPVPLRTAPYLSNDRTMVPARFVAEALGCSVAWDDITRTVNITQ